MDRSPRNDTVERRRLVLALVLTPLALLAGCGEAGSVHLGPGPSPDARPIGSPPPKTGRTGPRPGKDGKPKGFQPG